MTGGARTQRLGRALALAGAVALAGCQVSARGAGEPRTVMAKPTPTGEWKEYPVRTLASLEGFRPERRVRTCEYGGLLGTSAPATGFFHTRRVGERWWLVDPDGHLFIHVGVVALRPGGSEAQKAALRSRFGTEAEWMEREVELLRDHGFNGVGNWSSDSLMRAVPRPLPYTVNINPMNTLRNRHRAEQGGVYRNAGWQGYEHNLILVWDPRFEAIVEEAARGLARHRADPYLLGYFSDNELPFVNDALDRHLTRLVPTDPGHAAAREWLDARRGRDFPVSAITDEDRQAFLGFYAERYYSVVAAAIRRHDPNHLFLGSRFNQEREELRSPAVFAAAGRHANVISVNVYRVWEPGPGRLRSWTEWSGRPVMITEWYTKGDDAGMANTSGAGWIVPTQRDRGLFYQNFVLELLQSPGVVGWHWFRYQDNDPTDTTADPSNRDGNKGIVDASYRPYADLLTEMRTLNRQVYPLIRYFDEAAGRAMPADPVPPTR